MEREDFSPKYNLVKSSRSRIGNTSCIIFQAAGVSWFDVPSFRFSPRLLLAAKKQKPRDH